MLIGYKLNVSRYFQNLSFCTNYRQILKLESLQKQTCAAPCAAQANPGFLKIPDFISDLVLSPSPREEKEIEYVPSSQPEEKKTSFQISSPLSSEEGLIFRWSCDLLSLLWLQWDYRSLQIQGHGFCLWIRPWTGRPRMLSKVFSLRKYEENKMPFFSFTVKSFPAVCY